MANKKIYTIRLLRGLNDAGELTPEQVTRLSDIGFPFGTKSRSRPVICLETGERWFSMKEAASSLGCSATVVSGAIKTGRDICGRHLYYADSPKPDDDFFRLSRRPRPVTCLETGVTYKSSGAAVQALGLRSSKQIYAACTRGLAAGPQRLHFYYADEPVPTDSFFSKGRTAPHDIMCVETGEVFHGYKEVAERVNVSKSYVRQAIFRGVACGGLHFIFCNSELGGAKSIRPSRTRAVRCIETGEVFPSVSEATQKMGGSRRCAAISQAIKLGRRAYGCHWEYVDGHGRTAKAHRKVRCVETGEVFDCLRDAGASVSVSRNSVCAAIHSGGVSGGCHWEYVDSAGWSD